MDISFLCHDSTSVQVHHRGIGNKLRPRRLSDSIKHIASNATNSPTYSIEGYRLAEDVNKWIRQGSICSYFKDPIKFMEEMNNNNSFLRTQKPVEILDQELTLIDPMLLIRSIGVTLSNASFQYQFPSNVDLTNNSLQRVLMKKLDTSKSDVKTLK